MSTKKSILEVTLNEVSNKFISMKDNDVKRSQEVFKKVFELIKKNMNEKCNYFKYYSSQVVYGGSVSDGIKVSKLDEFDMDIIIRLPIHRDEIEIENDQPGFIKMKITNAFDNLDKQQNWESRHKVTREWRDSEKYFLQNKFRHWLHGIVQKAINDMNGQAEVNGSKFLLTYKQSGPAYTLNVKNAEGEEPFFLSIDLVPVIKFPGSKWPSGYRTIEGCQNLDWFVVPKPNKSITDDTLQNRCWRLSFQDYEREMIKGCNKLKQTIRLVKKLRDAQGLKAIASYYIKTLFLWKVSSKDKKYWDTKLVPIFRDMVQELYDAIEKKNIPYFWNEENNLIEGLKPSLQVIYVDKLKSVLEAIDSNNAEKVVAALLTPQEMKEFKQSDFYKQQLMKQLSTDSETSLPEQVKGLKADIGNYKNGKNDVNLMVLELKVKELADRVAAVEDRLKRLEMRNNIRELANYEVNGSAVESLVQFG